MSKTIFCDIDGCILYQYDQFLDGLDESKVVPTTNAARKLLDWHIQGHTIILITGRPESLRQQTVDALAQCDILYDMLIMGVGAGPRVLINDIDPQHPDVFKATSINLTRNKGIEQIDI
jgi:hydroxymethylpyrimidine pyrophosphatase-like HAD family hydrolase